MSTQPGPQAYQYGPPGYAPAPAPPTNVMAVWSLVSSILGITLLPAVGSVAGVVLGHIAMSQLKRTGESGRGLAIAGLVVGYSGVVIIGLIVAAILYAAAGLGMLVWMYS